MSAKIQFRRDTSTAWTANNPILSEGELGLELDTNQFKIGNGSTAWNSLPYGGMQGPAGTNGTDGGGIAIGDILWSTKETPPSGYLAANGQIVAKATYPTLYSIIGDQPQDNIYVHTNLGVSPSVAPGTLTSSSNVFISADSTCTYIAMACKEFTNKLEVYKRTGDSIQRLPQPVNTPNWINIYGVAVSPDGQYIAVCGYRLNTTAQQLAIYSRSGDTYNYLGLFGNAAGADTASVTLSQNGAAFSVSGEHLIAVNGSVGNSCISVLRLTAPDTFVQIPYTYPTATGDAPRAVYWADNNNFYSTGSWSNTIIYHAFVTGSTATAGFNANSGYSTQSMVIGNNNSLIFAINVGHTIGKVLYNNVAPAFGITSIYSNINRAYSISGLAVSYDKRVVAFVATSPASSPNFILAEDTGSKLNEIGGLSVMPNSPSRVIFAGFNPEYMLVSSTTAPYIYMYKRGYTYSTSSHFQVPMIADQKAGATTTLKAYIRAL